MCWLAVASIALSACSPGAGSSAKPATKPSPGSVATPTPIPTPQPPLAEGSIQKPGAECQTSSLRITIASDQGAGGSSIAGFRAENVSLVSCTLTGYFGLELLDQSGNQVGSSPSRDNGLGFSTGSRPATVTLLPRDFARFALQWWGNYGGAQYGPCHLADQIVLTAPDQRAHVMIPARLPSGSQILECGNGNKFIGPVSA